MAIASGVAAGTAAGVAGGMTIQIAIGSLGGIAVGIASRTALASALSFTRGAALTLVGVVLIGGTVGVSFGIFAGIAFGVAAAIAYSRIYYFPSHLALLLLFNVYRYLENISFLTQKKWLQTVIPLDLIRVGQRRLYPLHPVAWDHLCSFPLPGLEQLLIAYAQQASGAASREIERLTRSSAHETSALCAKIILLARQMRKQSSLANLDQIAARLPQGTKEPTSGMFIVRQFIEEISRRQRQLDGVIRPVFREPIAQSLRNEIERFLLFLNQPRVPLAGFPELQPVPVNLLESVDPRFLATGTRSQAAVGAVREPFASEFRDAATQWLVLADKQLLTAQAISFRTTVPQPFHAGRPIDRMQEAFVPRLSVYEQLERQLGSSSGCPGLVVYGRRRTGKSTLLRNVSGFLPSAFHVASLSMENPEAFTSLETLIRLIATEAARPWSGDADLALAEPTLSGVFSVLARTNARLKDAGRRLLITIDEFEILDDRIGRGVFPEEFLRMVRESIQDHSRITWAFAGSHHVTELIHAQWSSHLVSARTIEVSLFNPAETRSLLSDPLRFSPIWDKLDPKPFPFFGDIWGIDGIERIQEESAGWPHLVQLIAQNAVDLLNETTARSLDSAILERALDRAVELGDLVFRQLMEKDCRAPGEWEYLCGFRERDLQSPPEADAIYRSLRRRLLVVEEGGKWQLRVPLMQRWLRRRT